MVAVPIEVSRDFGRPFGSTTCGRWSGRVVMQGLDKKDDDFAAGVEKAAI